MSSGKKICHLTILNPAVHSRIFFKESRSLQRAGFEVSIVGQDPGKDPFVKEGVRIIPLAPFRRLSPRRISIKSRILSLALAEQADAYHIHSPELIDLALRIRKRRPEAKIVYDVHEDYDLNIRFGGYYPRLIKGRLGKFVRKKEKAFARIADGIIYAEDCFNNILQAPEEKVITVLNKFQPPKSLPAIEWPPLPRLLYTGTIAENWGIRESLNLWKELNDYRPVDLRVAGHSQDPDLIFRIQQFVRSNGLQSHFSMLGGNEYLPFEKILQEIASCSLGLGLYTPRTNLRERIPTKFYEFAAMGKPLLFTDNPTWNQFNAMHPIGEAWKGDINAVLDLLNPPYSPLSPTQSPAFWSWDSEEEKLVNFYQKLLI